MESDLCDKNDNSLKEDTSTHILLNLLSTSFLSKQNCSLDQPLEADSFKTHVKNCEANLKTVISLLENHNYYSTSLNRKLVINIILMYGEHSRNEFWTSSQTVKYAEKLLSFVLTKCNCKSVEDLLLRHKIDLILAELRPKLLKNTWKDNPAAVACFTWILFHIKFPDLADVLNSVLPTCFLLIDDHVYSNKIKGLQCLEHIAKNMSRAELNQYGRGSVIYNALEHMIYLREPEIILPLGACLQSLLSKTEHRPTTENLAWNHFDDVLNVWLPSMEMEQNLLLREAYIESLNSLLQAMGLASVRWSKKLLNVLSEYCEQEHTRDKAILNLLTFMKTTWPRLSFNFQPIVVMLMKLVISISKRSASENLPHSTMNLIKECFTLLEVICHEAYNSFLNDMKNCNEMKDYLLLISVRDL